MNQPNPNFMPNSPDISLPERAPSAVSVDDVVTPFEVATLDLRGRLVRLGPMVDEILTKHAYPAPVAKLLGEAIVLAVMLGSSLKMEGRFILQAQTDGPVGLLVVDYTTPGHVRACARFGKPGVDALVASGEATSSNLLGKGHLAMTIDQGENSQRYQGLVALDGMSLEDAAHEYFLRSEQIPTRVRLAVAEEIKPGSHRWRAGGVMLQFLPKSQERAQSDLHPGDLPHGHEFAPVMEDDAWVQGRALLETVEDIELIDPELSSERLAYRLFHEPGVRVFNAQDVKAQCSCSHEAVFSMLKSFPQDDRDHMVEDGKISVTCEFCNSTYVFKPEDVGANANQIGE
ncbi:MAG: Hsp33 family molecular chaperone [Pseudolabrys sp.]|jgi:molecular chaperone Hsp33